MSRYENRQELANKIDWEGGIFDMLFGYGLRAEDLPEGDVELAQRFAHIETLKGAFERAVDNLTELLPEPGDEEDY